MDFESFQAKYGYSAPVPGFKSGAKAGIIVAAILSALATLVVIFINTIVVLPYYGTGALGITHFLPLIAAALMVIMAGVAKPSNKIVLALPATVWLVNRVIAAVTSFRALSVMGAAQGGQMGVISGAAALAYAAVVALLMWVCCAGSGKSGTVCGVLVTVTAVLGFFVSFVGTFFSLLEAINYSYDNYMTILLSANIFVDAAGMLFYISCAAALFMIGAKPKTPPYYYAPTQPTQTGYPMQQPTQPTYPQTAPQPSDVPTTTQPSDVSTTNNDTEVK